jgi:uncharacterized protein YndB with AHSA1/START domain
MANINEAGKVSYGINHQVGIKATPAEIYKALTETDKLAQWWTIDTRGSGTKVGDTLEFWFNKASFCQHFTVKELEPGKRVVWKSPKGQGADQWEGTEVAFDLSTDEKQTFIQFRHSGWRKSTDFQGHCSMRWAVFLLSLKDVMERGKGRPIPYDLEVNYR